MFSSALVCLCVCLLAGLRKNYPTDFHKIRWKVAQGLRKKSLDFDCNLDHVMLGLRLGRVTAILHMGGYMSPGICLIITLFCDISGLGRGMRSTECHLVNFDNMQCTLPVSS